MDVLTFAITYARYRKNKEQKKGFRMKDCLSMVSSGWIFFNGERDTGNEDELFCNYAEN